MLLRVKFNSCVLVPVFFVVKNGVVHATDSHLAAIIAVSDLFNAWAVTEKDN